MNKETDFQLIHRYVVEVMDYAEEMANNPGGLAGLSSGFKVIDDMTSGICAGELIVLAGQCLTSTSALALNIAEHVALRERVPVAIFSMRMSGRELARRMLSSLAHTDLQRLRGGTWTADERTRLMAANAELETPYLHVNSAIGFTTNDLRKKLLKLAVALNSGRLGLLIVDALELIRPDMPHHGELAWDAGTTLHHLKFIAQEFQLPVMLLTQFPCAANASDACKPSLNDHPLSEVIGENADVVMVLNLEACGDQNQSRFGKATLKFSKLRDCVAGEVEIGFNRSPLRFSNLSSV